jgi:hypothetical protein
MTLTPRQIRLEREKAEAAERRATWPQENGELLWQGPFKILSICTGGQYRYCRTDPVHPKANSKRLYPYHRVQKENELGRFLGKDEIVHHANENKHDDRLENLEMVGRVEHAKHHAEHQAKREQPDIELQCPFCKERFFKPANYYMRSERDNQSGAGCSNRCAIQNDWIWRREMIE